MASKKEMTEVPITASFNKEQLIVAKKYRAHKDLVCALLADEKTYTISEVDSKIQEYLKGKVD